jgi:hypothetical protein
LSSQEENNFVSLNNSIKLKSVLKNKSIIYLKKHLNNEKRLKDKETRIDETKFRTKYEDLNIIDKLDEKLDYEINIYNINLIQYLNSKDIISDKLIEKLNTYKKNKVNKIDKICQMINEQEIKSRNISNYMKSNLSEFI